MRTEQIKLHFSDDSEFDEIWESIPLSQRTEIARCYARLLIKKAKVNPLNTKRKDVDNDR